MIKHESEAFSKEIERRVQELGMDYLEALTIYMQEADLDESKVKKLLTPNLKAKLEQECYDLNRFGKKLNRLPEDL